MVAVPSTMLPLGTQAPAFRLKDTRLKWVRLDDARGAPAYLVAFICNHCPYVHHLRRQFADVAREYQQKGVAVFAINSNDARKYPDDSVQKMAEEVGTWGYTFPYLVDDTQEIAIAYRAACTPDFFVFDKDQQLTYRGQFDDSRPGNGKPVTGADLRAALDATLAGKAIPESAQKPSIGCNIKWKPGNAPEYFPQG